MKPERLLAAAIILALLILAIPAQAQGMPHAIIGTVKDTAGNPLQGASVTLENARTGDSVSVLTDALGQYQADLSSMPGGYRVGDVINVKAVSGELEGSASVTVSGSALDECNITASERTGLGAVAIIGIAAAVVIVAVIVLLLMRPKGPKKAADKGRRRN